MIRALAATTLYLAALAAAFLAAPRVTLAVLEIAGAALFLRLWWLFATYAGRDGDPFASRKDRTT